MDIFSRLQILTKKEKVLEEKPEPILNKQELLFKNVIDAAVLLLIVKNEDTSGKMVQLPSSAINNLENALNQFSSKIFKHIETERAIYLKLLEKSVEKSS